MLSGDNMEILRFIIEIMLNIISFAAFAGAVLIIASLVTDISAIVKLPSALKRGWAKDLKQTGLIVCWCVSLIVLLGVSYGGLFGEFTYSPGFRLLAGAFLFLIVYRSESKIRGTIIAWAVAVLGGGLLFLAHRYSIPLRQIYMIFSVVFLFYLVRYVFSKKMKQEVR